MRRYRSARQAVSIDWLWKFWGAFILGHTSLVLGTALYMRGAGWRTELGAPVRPGTVGLRVLLGENGLTPLLRGFRHVDVHRVVGSNPAAAGIVVLSVGARAATTVKPRVCGDYGDCAGMDERRNCERGRPPAAAGMWAAAT